MQNIGECYFRIDPTLLVSIHDLQISLFIKQLMNKKRENRWEMIGIGSWGGPSYQRTLDWHVARNLKMIGCAVWPGILYTIFE